MIFIHCGDAKFEDSEFDTLINPVVIMEILSDSTGAFDRGKKFTYYRTIPTLREDILVSQDEYHVEQYIRSDEGKWEYHSYEGANQVLKMESVNCELPLYEIYWDIEFESK
nr:Uma2 family endonuclease [Desulfobacter hydrogenophilus]